MVLARRSQAATVRLLALLLLSALFCTATSLRRPLASQDDSTSNSVPLSDEEIKRVTDFAEEAFHDSDEDDPSLHRPDEDADDPMISIPQFMDRMISSAFSSVDRMSSGLLSGLAGPNIEYGRSEDGKRLIARIHLPPIDNKDGNTAVSPELSVAVLGRSHLRVKLDMRGNSFQSFSEHTYGLPVHVSSNGVTVTPQEDGTVHVSLRIVKEANEVPPVGNSDSEMDNQTRESFLERRLRHPLFPNLLHQDSLKASVSAEVVEELPKPEELDKCRAKYPSEKILRKKCTCDIIPSELGKAVCYASLISKAVMVSRRLGMNDFATSAKHHAIECADGHVDAVSCLEKVSSELLQSLYKEDSSALQGQQLLDHVRVAIESEDDGPSSFEPSYGSIFSLLLIALLVGLFACGAMLYVFRRFGGTSRSNRILSDLSSVLTQTRRPDAGGDVSSARHGSRLGPSQGTSRSSNSGVLRKPGPKSNTGDIKMA